MEILFKYVYVRKFLRIHRFQQKKPNQKTTTGIHIRPKFVTVFER